MDSWSLNGHQALDEPFGCVVSCLMNFGDNEQGANDRMPQKIEVQRTVQGDAEP